jgi:formamidopyrimidine-DNA glycosylase
MIRPMPELPEVEVLRRSLLRRLPGRRIVRVETRAPTLREPLDRRRLRRLLEGRRVEALRRRAKYLLIDVDGDATLIVHLGMSGRLTVVAGEEPYEEHEHFLCRLDDGRRLRLVDPRRFGLVFASRRGELAADRHFAHLGVEPLDGGLTGRYLAERVRGRRAPIKGFLMDAGVVVGVGNIYASETLWRAGVHPRRSTARISATAWERLAAETRAVLGDAIAQGGTTLNDFADGDGNAGYFQVALAVYGREGEPCGRCGRTIRRLVQAGRSTFYCPGCQR